MLERQLQPVKRVSCAKWFRLENFSGEVSRKRFAEGNDCGPRLSEAGGSRYHRGVSKLLKAIQFRNLDEARRTLDEILGPVTARDLLDDDGEEPQGLLTIISEDRLSEEDFHKFFGQKAGVLVEVEKIAYSGYGPPAEEHDYMGFVSEQTAYVLKGRRLPIEITHCPHGATDIHHLDAMILDGEHPINWEDLAKRLSLSPEANFDDIFEMICDGAFTANEVDEAIHRGIN